MENITNNRIRDFKLVFGYGGTIVGQTCIHEGSQQAVLIIPPDPNHGNMYTPTVDAMFRAFDKEGISVMRFSFIKFPTLHTNQDKRFSKYILQISMCLDELHQTTNAENIWIVGFSFGGVLALNTALRRSSEVAGFVMVAPLIAHYNALSWVESSEQMGLIIYGNQDTLAPQVIMEPYQEFLIKHNMEVTLEAVEGTHERLDNDAICAKILTFMNANSVNRAELYSLLNDIKQEYNTEDLDENVNLDEEAPDPLPGVE